MAGKLQRLSEADWPTLDAMTQFPRAKTPWLLAGFRPPVAGEQPDANALHQAGLLADLVASHQGEICSGVRSEWCRRDRLRELFDRCVELPRPELLFVETRANWYGATGTRLDHLDYFDIVDVADALADELEPTTPSASVGDAMTAMAKVLGPSDGDGGSTSAPSVGEAIRAGKILVPFDRGRISRGALRAWCIERGLRPASLFGKSPDGDEAVTGKARRSMLLLIAGLAHQPSLWEGGLSETRGRGVVLERICSQVGVSISRRTAGRILDDALELAEGLMPQVIPLMRAKGYRSCSETGGG